MERLTFEELEQKMAPLGGRPGVAESHGALAGMLCSAAQLTEGADWFRRVFPEAQLEGEQTAVMKQLHGETRAELVDDCFAFSPLLPDDGRPIEQPLCRCPGGVAGSGRDGAGGQLPAGWQRAG